MNLIKRPMNPAMVQTATAAQLQALDTTRSIWASANAGTGKTDMLTRRLIALLLHDPSLKPAQLLALTFSTAGAAEMAARLPRAVGALLALNDDDLAARVRSSLGLEPFAGVRTRLRTVAEQLAAEPPTVATFHGFAGRLLGALSNEASPTVLTPHAQKELLQHAIHLALDDADAPLQQAVSILLGQFHDRFWAEMTSKLVTEWHVFERSLMGRLGVEATATALRQAMDLPDNPQPAAVVLDPPTRAFFTDWARYLDAYAGGDESKLQERLYRLLASPDLSDWHHTVYDSKGELRSKPTIRKKDGPWTAPGPAFHEALALAAAAYEAVSGQHAAIQGYRLTVALLVWTEAVARAYRSLKQARGVIDFQDMLDALSHKMAEEGPAFWQRLDHSIRHVVLDEGQDTNTQQADLIVQMVHELVAQPEPGTTRTLLAVGDLKQSIYRFQGAVPQTFLSLRNTLQNALTAPARTVALTSSFRSAPGVLALVDAVFGADTNAPLAHAVLGEAAPWPTHTSVFDGAPSHLELWPTDTSEKIPEPEPWALPAPQTAPAGGTTRTAQRIVDTISNLVRTDHPAFLTSTGQPAKFGDMLVLVQRRETGHAVAAALAAAGIPYLAVLKEAPLPQPVEDILNVLDVLADPQATLPWLRVLKGPWFGPFAGVDDDLILALAHAADGKHIWPVLPQDARSWLEDLQHTLLQQGLAYTVQQACASINLLDRALTQTATGRAAAPTRKAEWQGWLDALVHLAQGHTSPLMLAEAVRAGELSPPPPAGDAVRILTVHGSKGLEAPVVFLPETQKAMSSLSANDWLLWARNPDTREPLFPLVRTGSGDHPLKTRLENDETSAKQADSLRLLYVALTRAKERIYIGGFAKESDDTWYALLKPALLALGATSMEDERLVLKHGADVAGTPDAATLPVAVPAWLLVPPVPVTAPVAVPDTPEQALGNAIHAALEDVLRQPERMDALLDAQPFDVAREVRQVLENHPRLFDTREAIWHGVEVDVGVARADGFQPGRADWVRVDRDTIQVIDFKTARTPPDYAPEPYRQQLRRYGLAVLSAYPAHSLKLGILWTVTAKLEDVEPAATLTAVLAEAPFKP